MKGLVEVVSIRKNVDPLYGEISSVEQGVQFYLQCAKAVGIEMSEDTVLSYRHAPQSLECSDTEMRRLYQGG